MSTLELRLPRVDEEAEFLRAHHATTPEVPNFLHDYDEGMPFARFLERLAAGARGDSLRPGLLISTRRSGDTGSTRD